MKDFSGVQTLDAECGCMITRGGIRSKNEDTTPPRIKKCAKLGHKTENEKSGNCLHSMLVAESAT